MAEGLKLDVQSGTNYSLKQTDLEQLTRRELLIVDQLKSKMS